MTEKTSQELFYPVLISVEEERCCYDCRFWRGRCCLNKPNKIAWSKRCLKFEPITSHVVYVVPEIVEVTA